MEHTSNTTNQDNQEKLAKRVERSAARAKNVGKTQRPARLQELTVILKAQLMLDGKIDPLTAERRAREEADAIVRRYARLDKRLKALAPHYSTTSDTDWIPEVLVHALLRQPHFRFISKLLSRKPSEARGNKSKGARQLPVATFLWMALACETANCKAVLNSFAGHSKRAWAVHYPAEGPKYKSLLKTMSACLKRNDPEVVKHLMVENARKLAAQTDPSGKLIVPDAMRYLATDGLLVKAPVAQHNGVNDEHKALLRGPERKNVGFIIYRSTRSFEQDPHAGGGDDGPHRGSPDADAAAPVVSSGVMKVCHGYKVVALHSIRLNVPVIADVFPADQDERKAVLLLLKELFKLWPDADVHALVGDSLYDSEMFCNELVFNWGIQPVFTKGRVHRKENDWTANSQDKERIGVNGVPCCKHGLMRFAKKQDYWDADKRRENGLDRGLPAPTKNFRIRWKCTAGICGEESTYPKHNARLYTLYPHLSLDALQEMEDAEFERQLSEHAQACADAKAAGTAPPPEPKRPTPTQTHGDYATDRLILRAYGNTIESLWSQLTGGYQGNHSTLKAAWAGDHEMRWLLLLGLARVTGKRLVILDDDYESARSEAETLDLLRIPTADNPQCGPTAQQLEAALNARPLPAPEAPPTWPAHRTGGVFDQHDREDDGEREDLLAA